jgi:hypothetical protein
MTEKHPFLKTKFQVGSVKSDKLNYPLTTRVFHRSDAPDFKIALKRETEKFKQPDYLELRPRPWNSSTLSTEQDPRDVGKLTLNAAKKHLIEHPRILKGTLDINALRLNDLSPSDKETLQFVKAITGKGPVACLHRKWFNTQDDRGISNFADWNSTTVVDRQLIKKLSKKHFNNQHPKKIPPHYLPPEEQVIELNSLIRAKKEKYQEKRNEIKQKLALDMPNASENKLAALANRILDEKLIQEEKMNRFPMPNECFRPNLALTTVDRRYKVWFHPGSLNQETKEWSCCLMSEGSKKENDGCEFKVKNPDKWCLNGFSN